MNGRILKKEGFLPSEPLRADTYKGNLYVLTNGLTYSGGSELASLIKAHRKATFVGRETGGGCYGNTSGFFLILDLPNTGIKIRIPLLKFSVNTFSNDIPFGRGFIPDYEIHETTENLIKGKVTEMEFIIEQIQ